MTGVLGLGVTAVIDLAIEEPPIQFPRDIAYCRFPLIDGSGNQPVILRAAIETTATFIKSGTPTLVACSAGMSRSPAIIAAAMSMQGDCSLVGALEKLTTGQPHDVFPSLLAEISDVMAAIGRVSQ